MTKLIEGSLIEISWASESLDEARKVARYLVQEKIVASAEIIPWIESIYLLNHQLETDQETKVLFKTTRERFLEVKEVIEKNSKYEIPEILFRTIEGGNEAYLDWIKIIRN